MVEQGDVVMAELTGTVKRVAGGEMRMSMAEVFVMALHSPGSPGALLLRDKPWVP